MDDFKQLIKIYKREFPDYKFLVRRVRLGHNTAGDCELVNKSKNQFLIRINNQIKEDEQLIWLIHEFAHAISWHYKTNDDHGVHWAKAYSKCYKIYEKYVSEDENYKNEN